MNEEIWHTPGLLIIAFDEALSDATTEDIFGGHQYRRFGKSVVIAFGYLTQFNARIFEVLGSPNVLIKPLPFPEGFDSVPEELQNWMRDRFMESMTLSAERKRAARQATQKA